MLEKIIVLLVVGVIAMMFLGNRLPQVMGDFGKGLRAFKDGMSEGNGDAAQPKRVASGTGGRGKGAKKTATKKTVAKKSS